jgi:tetratricopeptide (TPR) repeat protein
MRAGMIPWLYLVALCAASPAWADDRADCYEGTDPDTIIRGCGNIIAAGSDNPDDVATAYYDRGLAYGTKGDHDAEIADETKAIELDPQNADAYSDRGAAYASKGDYDSEIADQSKAIEINPKDEIAYYDRGLAYGEKGDHDAEIADESKAIELNPQDADAYVNRALAYDGKGDSDHAIADYDKAIELNPQNTDAYVNRGYARGNKGDYDGEIADESKAIEINPQDTDAYVNRGYAYGNNEDRESEITDESKAIELDAKNADAYIQRADAYAANGDPAKALVDLRAAAELIPESDEQHATVASRIAELEKQIASVATAPANSSPPAAVASVGRRVALVIGNSEYAAVGKLDNPERDAEAIAAALKDDGFEVTTADNLTRADFIAAINQFSDAAAAADWATIYFAGHGLQLEGVNYLIPVDAKLVADRDAQDEAIALDRVIAAVSGARKLGLIIVDACRNDPFLTNMHFTAGARAARTRGLARIAPQGTTLVEFSARDGQEAQDGDPAGNSPFAAALAKRLAAPGLEVGKLLRQVREDVLAATSNQQEPMFAGDLPAEDVFFRPPQ